MLHAWLEAELLAILASLPPVKMFPEVDHRAAWERWQAGLTVKPTLPDKLPRLRLLLIMDNLARHLAVRFVVWLFERGVMPLYTPLSGSWLNMTESMQRILAGRALAGQTLANSVELIEWLEGHCSCLERRSCAIRIGWQTSTSSATRVSPTPSTRRSWSLYAQTNPTPDPVHRPMAKFRSSDH
jgi:hypothetical protein